jgi:hypothetical protein
VVVLNRLTAAYKNSLFYQKGARTVDEAST